MANHEHHHKDRNGNHDKGRNGNYDRVPLTGRQHYEAHYLARKFGVAPSKVEEAIRQVGDDRRKIEEYIQNRVKHNGNHNNNHGSSPH